MARPLKWYMSEVPPPQKLSAAPLFIDNVLTIRLKQPCILIISDGYRLLWRRHSALPFRLYDSGRKPNATSSLSGPLPWEAQVVTLNDYHSSLYHYQPTGFLAPTAQGIFLHTIFTITMVEQQQYITSGLPHQDLAGPHGLPENDRSPVALPTTTYSDITPFAAVCFFFQPPSSVRLQSFDTYFYSWFPPLHQLRKPARQHYPPPPTTPYTQVPTPPGSSKMYHQWSNQPFDMNSQASQASSPMNNPAPVAQEFYVDERRTPGPPEPYLGSYGVSEGPEPQPIHHQGPPYYIDVPVENQSHMSHGHLQMDRSAPPPAPLLSQSHPSYRGPLRQTSVDYHSTSSHQEIRRSSSGSSPRRGAARATTQGTTRVTKSTKRNGKRGPNARNNSQLDPADDHKNCYGEEVAPTLKSTCPEEERCIFESRWRHRHQRGQDMWDSIQNDFYTRFKKQHGKEMLQMKFKRGRAKYQLWIDRDEHLLREAFRKTERERYQTILSHFLEMGGSRNMLLSASDIEIKLVNDMKLEDNIYVEAGEELDVRRRRRTTIKKRSGGRGEQSGDVAVRDEMLTAMSHPNLTEDDVINQVYERRDRWDEESSTNSEMMDVHMWDSRAPMKIEPGTLVPPQGGHILKAHNTHPVSHAVGGPAHQSLYHGRK
ncbi:hypothetical protein PT974_06081 [Cladobotryum mycophilum]|uniref:Clr5 domain-containing protein n=1 Tax=Cladobotryum mycophilum TaxID=491253 RepID=A0ABR0SKI4_9HYPO